MNELKFSTSSHRKLAISFTIFFPSYIIVPRSQIFLVIMNDDTLYTVVSKALKRCLMN